MKLFKSLFFFAIATYFNAAWATYCDYYYHESKTRVKTDTLYSVTQGYYLIDDHGDKGSFYYTEERCYRASTECKQILVSDAKYVYPGDIGVPFAEDRYGIKVASAVYQYRFQNKKNMSGAEEYVKSFKNKSECSKYQDSIATKLALLNK